MTVIPATSKFVVDTHRGVTLANQNATIKTVEHLLAALRWLGVTGVEIHVKGEEIPVLDGSALPWIELLEPFLEETSAGFPEKILTKSLFLQDKEAWLKITPAPSLEIDYAINFPETPIGDQRWHGAISPEIFRANLAPARTFGFIEEAAALQRQGLALGGNLDSCVVMSKNSVLTPLRFNDEMVRHKVLDLLGDLALLAWIPKMKIEAYKASHRLHIQLVQLLEEHG